MKRFGTLLVGIICGMGLGACTSPSAPKPTEEKGIFPEDKAILNTVDEGDTTDVYAVPLDTSEEEEQVEEQALKETQKEIQQEKATPAAPAK
jgi:hypothetical protein